jgi:superfamily II DNA or RNA helicase
MNVWLTERSNWTYVQSDNANWAWRWLNEALTVPTEADDPAMTCFDWEAGRFPRGFTPRIVHQLYQQGVQVHWGRDEMQLRNPDFRPPAGELRHFQSWAVEEMAKHEYGILDIATRFGKSYVYAGWYARMGRPMTLIIVPRAAIAQQMQEELSEWLGEPVGLVAGSVNPTPEWQNITVAIEQSLCDPGGFVRREHIPYLQAVEARIRDECHILGELMVPLIQAMPWCKYAWAASATPFTEKPKQNYLMIGWHGDTRVRISSRFLADHGILAQVEAFFHRLHHPADLRTTDWDEIYKSQVVNNTDRNDLIAKIARYEMERGRNGLIFINHVKHGKNILEHVPGAVLVSSKELTQKQCNQIKADFNAGLAQCVIVTKKWREGVTLHADFAINAEGSKADHVTVQKLGRGLLPKESGAPLRWHDIDDSGIGSLNRHSRMRRDSLLREEWPVVRFPDFEAFVRADADPVMRAMIELDMALENSVG